MNYENVKCDVCEGRGLVPVPNKGYLEKCFTCGGYGYSVQETSKQPVSDIGIKELTFAIHAVNVGNGFYDEPVNRGTFLALVHSEVSEALEADRKGDEENFKEELADVIIRVLDRCGFENIDISKEVVKKMEANKRRGHKHGKRY